MNLGPGPPAAEWAADLPEEAASARQPSAACCAAAAVPAAATAHQMALESQAEDCFSKRVHNLLPVRPLTTLLKRLQAAGDL